MQQSVSELIKNKLVESVHDISEGGLFIALMESGFNRNLGFELITGEASLRADAYLFGEAQSRVVVSVTANKLASFKDILQKNKVNSTQIGIVTEGVIKIDAENWGSITEWKNKYDNAIGDLLAGQESEQALAAL